MLNSSYLLNLNYPSSQEMFSRLSFYESSFHFFLHRTNFFASLSSNIVTSTLTPDQGVSKTVTQPLNLNNLYLTTLGNSFRNILRLDNLNLHSFNKGGFDTSSDHLDSKRDALIIKSDRDLLNLRSLEILFNISKSNSLISQKFQFFSYIKPVTYPTPLTGSK